MTLKDLNQESDKESLKKHTDEIGLNEKHLSLIYDTLSDVIFLLAVEPDDCFRFVTVNQAFLAVTGLSREQVVGKRFEQVLPETAHALVISKYNEAINDNKTVFFEQASTFPSSEHVGVVTVTPVCNAEGVCTHLVGTVQDLTERKHAEMSLKKEREFSQNILDTAQAIILLLDVDGKIISINPYMEHITGYSSDEVIGKDWFTTFLQSSDHERIRNLFKTALNISTTKGNINSVLR